MGGQGGEKGTPRGGEMSKARQPGPEGLGLFRTWLPKRQGQTNKKDSASLLRV